MTVKTSPQPAASPDANHEPLSGARWADLFSETGVQNDTDGTSWRVTADGSSTTVTVGGVGDELVILGHLARITAAETVSLAAGAPTAGQERYVRIVARLNLTTFVVSVVAIVGGVAASGAATVPPFVRDVTSYDQPLAIVKQTNVAITQAQVTDERAWVTRDMLLTPAAALPADAPIGAIVWRDLVQFRRVLVGTVPTWYRMNAELAAPVQWPWGAPVYNWQSSSGSWVTPPGAEQAIDVQAGHLYELESTWTFRSDSDGNKIWRASAWLGGALRREIGGVLRGSDGADDAGEPSFTIRGWWRATTTGRATFATRVAFNSTVRIYSRFASPSSVVIDHGLCKA